MTPVRGEIGARSGLRVQRSRRKGGFFVAKNGPTLQMREVGRLLSIDLLCACLSHIAQLVDVISPPKTLFRFSGANVD